MLTISKQWGWICFLFTHCTHSWSSESGCISSVSLFLSLLFFSLSEVSVHTFLLRSGSGLIDCVEFLQLHSVFRMRHMNKKHILFAYRWNFTFFAVTLLSSFSITDLFRLSRKMNKTYWVRLKLSISRLLGFCRFSSTTVHQIQFATNYDTADYLCSNKTWLTHRVRFHTESSPNNDHSVIIYSLRYFSLIHDIWQPNVDPIYICVKKYWYIL